MVISLPTESQRLMLGKSMKIMVYCFNNSRTAQLALMNNIYIYYEVVTAWSGGAEVGRFWGRARAPKIMMFIDFPYVFQ